MTNHFRTMAYNAVIDNLQHDDRNSEWATLLRDTLDEYPTNGLNLAYNVVYNHCVFAERDARASGDTIKQEFYSNNLNALKLANELDNN